MFEDPCERLRLYIKNFLESFGRARILDSSCRRIVELAKMYVEDAKYFLDKGDCITGLIAVSYAEGLMDACRELGCVELSWARSRRFTVVVAAGSFDVVHPGHIEFLRRASKEGDKLFVIISRDSRYRRLRGRDPVFNERERLEIVSAIRYVYRAVLGDENDILKPLENIKPDVVVLGPDQRVDEEWLVAELRRRGVEAKVVRVPERVGGFSSSEIKKRIARLWLNIEC